MSYKLRPRIVDTFQLGSGSILLLATFPPAVYLMLGYASNPTLAIQSIIILVAGFGAVFARQRIDTLYPVRFSPLIKSTFWQTVTVLAVYGLILIVGKQIFNAQLASLSTTPTSELAVLVQTSIMETLVIQFATFYGLWAAGVYIFKSYTFAFLVALPISSLWAFIFHTYVYPLVPLLYVFYAFSILTSGYWLTGNVLVPMIPHLLIDSLTLFLMFLGVCPGLGGLC